MSADVIRSYVALGIRFWDPAAGFAVNDGLSVRAHRMDGSSGPVEAFRTSRGLYAFRGLFGLQDLERPSDPLPAVPTVVPPAEFAIEVRDRRFRYVPTARRITLPLDRRGSFPLPSLSSLPDDAPGFHLFSDARRRPGTAMMVVRAELVDANLGEPAAHALVSVEIDDEGVVHYGMSDAEGRVAVMFPVPPLVTELSGSPPRGRQALAASQWNLTIRVRYSPELTRLPGTHLPNVPDSSLPDHRDIFSQNPAGIFLDDPTSSPPNLTPALGATLEFGEALVLTSAGSSRLWVEPPGP